MRCQDGSYKYLLCRGEHELLSVLYFGIVTDINLPEGHGALAFSSLRLRNVIAN
jgi:hypothetical protein